MAAPPAPRRPGLGRAAARARAGHAAAAAGGGPRQRSACIGEPCLIHGQAHAATSRGPTRPRATGEKFTKTQERGVTSRRPRRPAQQLRPGVAAPTSFLVPTRLRRGKPRTRARAEPAQVKRGLQPQHRQPRKPKEKDAAFRLPTLQEGAGGAGSGRGRPAEGSTLAAQILFSLSARQRRGRREV